MTEGILIIVAVFTVVCFGSLGAFYWQLRKDDRKFAEHLRQRYRR